MEEYGVKMPATKYETTEIHTARSKPTEAV